MRPIKAARKLMEDEPENPAAKTLAALVLALANETPYALNDLYALPPREFELALDVLRDWRLDRFYAGKAKLFDLSYQVGQEPRVAFATTDPW